MTTNNASLPGIVHTSLFKLGGTLQGVRKGWWSNGVSAHGLGVARDEEGLVV